MSVGLRDLLRRGWPLLALALAARVVQIIATPDWTPVADPADYVRHAVSLAHGHGFPQTVLPQGGPSALRPPAYPWFLGGVFALSGDSETAGRIASALLGVVTVALIGLLAQMLWGRRAALTAMAIGAVYPPLVLVSGTLLSEALALPLMLGALILAMRRQAVWAGLLFGLALLDRPALAVLAVALVATLWPLRRQVALALAVAALVVVPWTGRNAVRFDAFVPISDQSGFLIAGTYNEVSDHDPVAPAANRPPGVTPAMRKILATPKLDENEISKKLGALGRDYAHDHPGYVPKVLWWNGLRLFSLSRGIETGKAAYAFQGIGPGWAKLAIWTFRLLAIAALAGLALGAARAAPWWLWVTALLLVLSVITISGDVRYRLPVEPFLILLAAFLTSRRREPRQEPS